MDVSTTAQAAWTKKCWRSGARLLYRLVLGCKHAVAGNAPQLSGVGETSAVQRAGRKKSEENCLKLSPICAQLKLPAN